ncbi:MAG: hypothetical protein WBC44_21890 [Planctomycetaceae bacterium]
MSATPPFAACSLQSGRIEFAAPGSDDPDRRVRVVSAPKSFAESDDLAVIEEKAYARLGREPEDTVYLIDRERRLIRALSVDNRKLYESIERHGRWQFIAWTLFVLCLIPFVASAIGGMPLLGLAIFALASLLYLGIILTGLQNEVEGAIVGFVVLILCLLMLPAIQNARERHVESTRDTQSDSARSFKH